MKNTKCCPKCKSQNIVRVPDKLKKSVTRLSILLDKHWSGYAGSVEVSYGQTGAFVMLLIMVAVSCNILCVQNYKK